MRSSLWKEEWKHMPEFVQEEVPIYRKIVIYFECDEDVKSFSETIKQSITEKTKHLWFPKREKRKPLIYIDGE